MEHTVIAGTSLSRLHFFQDPLKRAAAGVTKTRFQIPRQLECSVHPPCSGASWILSASWQSTADRHHRHPRRSHHLGVTEQLSLGKGVVSTVATHRAGLSGKRGPFQRRACGTAEEHRGVHQQEG